MRDLTTRSSSRRSRRSTPLDAALCALAAVAALGLVACAEPKATPDSSAASGTAKGATTQGAAAPVDVKGKAELGQPAPDFTLTDLDGKTVKLSDHKGKVVVLEWFNPDCPFVKRNHGEGPLKTMAKDVQAKGVVWLAINSGAPGKQGHGKATNEAGRDRYGMTSPILLDETGAVGRAYGAQTTPHMYVVDEAGVLVYRGAIDNAPDGDPSEGTVVRNYVAEALDDVLAKKPVRTKEIEAYGCKVKYGS